MRLLLDQNLGPSLSRRLADLCAQIFHVRDFRLAESDDSTIWSLAAQDGFTIMTKDSDFRDKATLLGAPPKVVFLSIGNCPLADVEGILRRAWPLIERLHQEPAASLLFVTRDATFLLLSTRRGRGGPGAL